MLRWTLHVDCGDDEGPGPLRVYISVDHNTRGLRLPTLGSSYTPVDIVWRVDGPMKREVQSVWNKDPGDIFSAGNSWLYTWYHAPDLDNSEIVDALYAGATKFEWAPRVGVRFRSWDVTGFPSAIQPVFDECPGVTLPS